MTLHEFLQDKTLTAVDIVDFDYNQIINVYLGGSVYGLKANTENIPIGTLLEYRTDFTLEGDILTISDLSININDIEML